MATRTEITTYKLVCPELPVAELRIAVAADLHNRAVSEQMQLLDKTAGFNPDLIAAPGDITSKLCDGGDSENENGFSFLRCLAEIAPTYYSLGNHERHCDAENAETVKSTGAVLLDNGYEIFKTRSGGEILIGGLSSGGADKYLKKTMPPDTDFISRFEKLDGYKILLSHHPEYFSKYIKNKKIDLVLSGHAHGGQWRFFNRGVFSPGQGIFPKYTCGLYHDRMIVSRGLNNISGVPRIFDPYELVFIVISNK